MEAQSRKLVEALLASAIDGLAQVKTVVQNVGKKPMEPVKHVPLHRLTHLAAGWTVSVRDSNLDAHSVKHAIVEKLLDGVASNLQHAVVALNQQATGPARVEDSSICPPKLDNI